MTSPSPSQDEIGLPSAWAQVAAGAICLAIAMGIGRFAYTSILPLMISEGALDLNYGGTLASSNYLGYLVGALGCVLIPNHWSSARLARWGLLATVLLTAGMMIHSPALWLVLRFLSGAVSGVTLVQASRWCLSAMTRRGSTALGSAMFTGVGLGIAVSGVVATVMISADLSWEAAWGGFALTAALLLALIWRLVDPATEYRPPARPRAAAHPARGTWRPALPDRQLSLFTLAYGLCGFGYIITATYLPVIARIELPPSVLLDLFWPIYGLAAAAGSLLVTRIHGRMETRAMLIVCHVMQAAGVGLSTVWPSTAGFILGSVIAGLPFTALNFLAMDEAARLQPHRPAQFIGLLTGAFALGQIFGPPLVQVVMRHTADPGTGFDLSLRIASAMLLLAAGIYVYLRRRYP